MEFWLDCLHLDSIQRAKDVGLLHGVTTNPSILSTAYPQPLKDVLCRFTDFVPGMIAIQVTERYKDGMIRQAEALRRFSNKFIVKIPATEEGLKALLILKKKDIPTMATAIVDPIQGLLAAKAGACYLAVYYKRSKEKAPELLSLLKQSLHDLPTKLLVASLDYEHLEVCMKTDVDAVTLREDVFKRCLATPLAAIKALDQFENDWGKTYRDFTI